MINIVMETMVYISNQTAVAVKHTDDLGESNKCTVIEFIHQKHCTRNVYFQYKPVSTILSSCLFLVVVVVSLLLTACNQATRQSRAQSLYQMYFFRWTWRNFNKFFSSSWRIFLFRRIAKRLNPSLCCAVSRLLTFSWISWSLQWHNLFGASFFVILIGFASHLAHIKSDPNIIPNKSHWFLYLTVLNGFTY